MNGEIVQLHDSAAHPNGRRYSDEDREAAYVLWKFSAGRSYRKVAELLNMSPSTIGTWSQDGKWVDRARREDQQAIESARRSIAAVFFEQVSKSINTIVELRDNPATPAKVRLDAAIAALGYAGIAQAKVTADTLLDTTASSELGDVTDYRTMPTAELLSAERRLRQAS